MYGTSLMAPSSFDAIDDAFLRLRRLWAASRHRVVDDGVLAVEMSSLLVIEACARQAERGREANVSDVAFLADVAPSTASRLVDVAEAAGLLTRARSAHSARRTALVLTEEGVALRTRAVAIRQRWLREQLADWDAADVQQFGRLLQRFADQLHGSFDDATFVGDRSDAERGGPSTGAT